MSFDVYYSFVKSLIILACPDVLTEALLFLPDVHVTYYKNLFNVTTLQNVCKTVFMDACQMNLCRVKTLYKFPLHVNLREIIVRFPQDIFSF